MRHTRSPGDAQLHSRPDQPRRPDHPRRPALPAGVHELSELRPAGGLAGLLLVPSVLLPSNPLLVFFHGAGGSAATSLPLVQSAADRHGCLVLLPTSAGRTWDFLVGGWGPDVARIDDALALVFERFAVSSVAFGGFSDGASYALSIGLANGDLADPLLAFSPGFAAPPARVGRPRVWISHGTEDAVLPIDRCGRPTARGLSQAGYDVNYHEFAGPHTVPPDCVDRALRWWLAKDESS